MRCYFKGALAVIHLNDTVIISGRYLQWSRLLCFLETSTCSHFFFQNWFAIPLQPLIRWYSPFCYKRVIAATHSFKFPVLLQSRNVSRWCHNDFDTSLISGLYILKEVCYMMTSFPSFHFFWVIISWEHLKWSITSRTLCLFHNACCSHPIKQAVCGLFEENHCSSLNL